MLLFVAGLLLGGSLVLVVNNFLKPKIASLGAQIHLSLDKAEEALLAEGKLVNARVSQVKDLAEKAYGETGLSVIVKEVF